MSLVAQSHARYVQSLGEVEAHKQQAHSAVQEQARLRDELAALKSRVEAATSTQLQVDQLEVQLLQQKQENATLRCKLAASEELLQQVTAVKGGNAAAINASFNCSTHALMEALEHQRVAMEVRMCIPLSALCSWSFPRLSLIPPRFVIDFHTHAQYRP